jgi:hypothetical protein
MRGITMNEEDLCVERDLGNTPCSGDVLSYLSKSGLTVTLRCELHQDEHRERMEELEGRLQRDYPGYDNPHSSPPAWFDPTYAGERWDDDY